MALNAASHNPTGEQTGPSSGQPPPLSSEAKTAIMESAKQDASGKTLPTRPADGNADVAAEPKIKSAKQLEKEKQKAEKARKFAEKQAKQSAAAGTSSKAAQKKEESASAKAKVPEYVEETPKGHKKILKPLEDEFRKAYIPKVVESAWYDWWEKEGFFQPEFTEDGKVKDAGYFVIPEPPPNVTGALHCGHALATALQDTMIRWNRMKGLTTLWLPGCDHAGISTQSVVEKRLLAKGETRYDYGRTEFTKLIWKWKEEYHMKINTVLKRMGGSFDWTREAFTMDENLSAAVTETFVRLHREKLIYRSNRLVNWCVQLNTALSNLEVDNLELTGRTKLSVPGYERRIDFGVLTFFKYPIEGADGEHITVATTRPETMLGDTGIAVHPNDERYKSLVGKKAKHPFVDRLLPIIADDYVDPEFGTGAVKLTPASDPNDFTLGKKHNLEFINILSDNGTLNKNTGEFSGQKRFEARYTVVQRLKDLDLWVEEKDNAMKVPLCSKTKDVIEPIMKPQWWMKMEGLAKEAIEVVKDGQIKIRPETAERSYFRWMENINDWCLSRQLWWGHQAPAYLVKLEGEEGDAADDEYWVSGVTEEDAMNEATAKFKGKKFTLERDPDVLDTWFSSGLWPFSTLGWPRETHDLKHLFPTSVLETGWDILFFWVARMIMMSLKLTGKVPFTEVYCHSLIRDSEGRKMSKSLGNVVDPIDIMEGITLPELKQKLLEGNLDPKELPIATKYQETAFKQGIPECGADALRMSLVAYTTGGGDIAFDVQVIHAYRKFCNKIYQATKYVLGKIDSDFKPLSKPQKTGKESLAERWILHKLTIAAKEINHLLAEREFSKATQTAYQLFYDNLCDIYIENSKAIIQDGSAEEKESAVQTLYTALEGALKMLHPFMPFITEELWQRLPRRDGDTTRSIVIASYPQYDSAMDDPASESTYELLLGCSKGIRSLKAEYNIRDDAQAYIQGDSESRRIAEQELASIKALSGKGGADVTVLPQDSAAPTGCAVFGVSAKVAVYLEVKGRVDIDAEIKKTQGKIKKAAEAVAKQRKLMAASEGSEKMSEAVKEGERRRLEDVLAEQGNYERSLEQFQKLKLEG